MYISKLVINCKIYLWDTVLPFDTILATITYNLETIIEGYIQTLQGCVHFAKVNAKFVKN